MKPKTKYLIILIGVTGLAFLIYNSIKMMYWGIQYQMIAKVLYIIGVAGLFIYFLIKKWRKILTKTMLLTFSISLAISVYSIYQFYQWNNYLKKRNEYSQIKTCEGLKERFALDLENNEIKYFLFGMGTDIDLAKKLKKKYDIESFGMGCIVDFKKVNCYNKLVNEHLKEKHNDSIVD